MKAQNKWTTNNHLYWTAGYPILIYIILMYQLKIFKEIVTYYLTVRKGKKNSEKTIKITIQVYSFSHN
jgi:hypothetical protein